ncbi:MAG: restriction endonuclease subunit S [Bacteroidales bacterium]|jgi:type I restriction enzyme S subunit
MIETEIKYKTHNISWLSEVPEHWKVIRIKNIFKEIDNRSINGDEELLSVSQYTGVTPKRDSLENEDDFISNAETLENYKKVAVGDLVINIMLAWNGSLGVSTYDGITSPAYCVYRCLPPNNPEYFGCLFSTSLFKAEFRRNSTGIIDSRLRLYSDKFFSIFSFVPPAEEQNKIVEHIKKQSEKINRFIEAKKCFIKLLKEQRQSIIDYSITEGKGEWISKKLKFIADLRFSNVDKHSIEDEIPVRLCNYVDVYKNDYIINNMELMLATATEREIERFKIFKGDVIITKDSEEARDIAVPVFVSEDLENVICGYHLGLIRVDETQILNEFLFRVFQSKKIRTYFEVRANGVTRVGLSMDDISGVKIAFPKSLKEQQKIILYIKTETASIDTAISKAEREIELIKEYKEAMIAEAVMGEI